MALADSLLSAIVRADGDALVMHVGERPYVVIGSQTINISAHGLNLDAMTGMLTQLLTAEAHVQLDEFGAVEHRLPQIGEDRFSVVAARGGDDIWIEIRRRRPKLAALAPDVTTTESPAVATPAGVEAAPTESAPIEAAPVEARVEPAPEPIAEPAAQEPPAAEAVLAEAASIPDVVPEPPVESMPVAASEAATIVAPPPAFELTAEQPALLEETPVETTIAAPLIEAPIVEPPVTEMAIADAAPAAALFAEAPFAEAPVVEPQPVEAPPIVEVAHVEAPVAEVAQVVEVPILESTAVEPQILDAPLPAIAEVGQVGEAPTLESAPELPVVGERAPAIPEVAEVVEAPAAAAPAIVEPAIIEPAIVEPAIVEPAMVEPAIVEPAIVQPAIVEPPIAEPPIVEQAPIEEPAPMVEAVAELPVEESTVAAEPPATIAASVETPTALVEIPTVEVPEDKATEPEPPAPTPVVEPEVELPLTRTVRIEVPPRPAVPRTTPAIDRLLRVAAARGATALYLLSDSQPSVRVDGDLRHIDTEGALTRAEVESAILEIAPESAYESIGRGETSEWITEFADVGRMRCTTFVDHRGPGVVLRMIATRAATAEQLGLSREVQALATEPQGLVLVAGPRAGGKSTLLSALVDHVNRQRADYIITLERQVRLLHDHRQGLISQREIRGGPDDLLSATRSALRENPGVLVIDDLVSPQMVPLLLTAASDGLLVFVSITAASTADAIARFVELTPPETRKAALNSMAESFRGAVAQVLLKKAGGGFVAARELLLATRPVTRALAEGQLGQLPAAIEAGRSYGMVSFTDALAEFVRSGEVDVREAFRKAPERDRLLETLKRDGIDTSVVERLA